MKKREEIEERYKWDLGKLFENDQKFYEKLDEIGKKTEKIKNFAGKLSNDDVLFEFLEFECELEKELGFLAYAFYRECENTADRKASEMVAKRSFVVNKISKELTIINTEIDKFSVKKLQNLHDNPKFCNYKRYFEIKIRDKKHQLSKKEEILLSNLHPFIGGYSDNFDKFSDADLDFGEILDSRGKKHELNHSKFSIYSQSKDRTLRENAYKTINGKYGEFINFLATNYIGNVKEDCSIAKVRNYKSALDAALDSEEVSEKVYNLLIEKVHAHVDVLQRYFEIKRRSLGLEKIAVFDTFAPISHAPQKKYTYDEAIELVKTAVSPLGEEYVSLIQRAKDERWVDVMPNENKYSGAYSSHSYGRTPVVLMNFEGDLGSVFTLAHELGHAMHSFYSSENQPIQTADYVIFVAEVASTTNEMLLLRYLLEHAQSDDEKISLYDRFLQEVRSTIFRQTMFAEFEQFAHEEYEKENPLSAEMLCDKYEQLNNFYHGKKVKQIKEMRFEWARIPHFYDSFYVYKYATGMVSAVEISNKILTEKGFAKKYLKFLSSGCITDPVNLLRIAECDLEKEQTFDDAFAVCEEFLDAWEKLLKK